MRYRLTDFCAPDYAYDFDLTISEGDSILLTVKSTSDTAGTATIENETTGKSVSKSFSGDVQGDLCGYDAEWIVEDVSLPCLIVSPSLLSSSFPYLPGPSSIALVDHGSYSRLPVA